MWEVVKMRFNRGDVFWIKPSIKGDHTMRKRRPYVIVSCEKNNRYAPIVNVVALSTKSMDKLPMHVEINLNGVPNIAECEHVYTISKEEIKEEDFVDKLSTKEMHNISLALGRQLGVIPFDTKREV